MTTKIFINFYIINYMDIKASQVLTMTFQPCLKVEWQETPLLVSLLTVCTLLIKTQTRGCAFLHLPSALWVEYVKFHNSLCLFDSRNTTAARAVSRMENPGAGGEELEQIWWSMDGCRDIPQSAGDYRGAGHSHIVFMTFLCYISQSPINSLHCLQD